MAKRDKSEVTDTRALTVFPLKSKSARVALIAHDDRYEPRVCLEVDGKSIELEEAEWDRITETINRMFALVEPFGDDFAHGSGGQSAV